MMMLLFAAMVVILLIILYVYKHRGTLRFANAAILTSFFVVIGLCYMLLSESGIIGDKGAAIIENELRYKLACAFALANKVAEKHKSGTVVVFMRESPGSNKFTERSFKEIEKTLKGSGLKVESKVVQNKQLPASGDGMYDMEMRGVEDFKTLLALDTACVAVISLIDVPYESVMSEDEQSALWKSMSEKFDLYLANGNASVLAPFITAGYIDGLVSWKPNTRFSRDTAPRDKQEAFAKRYMIVDSSNIAELVPPEVPASQPVQ